MDSSLAPQYGWVTDIQQSPDRHFRCNNCSEVVNYLSGTGNVRRLWKCCQCSFAENSSVLDEACSFCHGLFLDIEPAEGYLLCQQSDYALPGFEREKSNLFSPRHIVYSPEPRPRDKSTNLTKDDINQCRFEKLLDSEGIEIPVSLDLDIWDDSNGYGQATDVAFAYEHDTQIEVRGKEGFLLGGNVTYATSSEDEVGAAMLIGSNRGRSQIGKQNDSAYGSRDFYEDDDLVSSKRRRGGAEEADTTITARTESASTKTSKKRRRLNSSLIGLACPFYKRDRVNCRQKSCIGPGPLGMNNLRQHLRRNHLFFRCERCGHVFPGEKGADALATHRRGPPLCPLQTMLPPPPNWGIDQKTLSLLNYWPRDMSEKQQWMNMYALVIHDAATFGLPRSHLADDNALSGCSDSVPASLEVEQQAMDNYSREILRILPNLLTERIKRNTSDQSFLEIWNKFARDHLHDFLRDTLAEIVPIPRNVPPISEVAGLGTPLRSGSTRQTDSITSIDAQSANLDSDFEFFDFEMLFDAAHNANPHTSEDRESPPISFELKAGAA